MSETKLNPEEAFNYSMNNYPSLYAANSEKVSKFLFYDAMFNLMGNYEIADKKDMTEEELLKTISCPEKYTNKELLYYFYYMTKIDDVVMPDYSNPIPGLYLESEKENFKEEIYMINLEKKDYGVPFQNFDKNYSMIWLNVKSLSNDWLVAAIDYYTQAKEFFHSENEQFYGRAVPKDPKEKKELERIYKETLDSYMSHETEEEALKSIEKDFGLAYNGNIEEFVELRWQKEKGRILEFIDETLAYVSNELDSRKSLNFKP